MISMINHKFFSISISISYTSTCVCVTLCLQKFKILKTENNGLLHSEMGNSPLQRDITFAGTTPSSKGDGEEGRRLRCRTSLSPLREVNDQVLRKQVSEEFETQEVRYISYVTTIILNIYIYMYTGSNERV